ncbi:Intraflagellar transport protein 27 [Chytriomyces hyalinus]|nr:Intraflagellar transport protein 27 [Chytriomyces hyalinus]
MSTLSLQASKNVLRCKCIVLGNQGVGKTSLVQVFQSDGAQFPKNYNMTINSEVCVKVVNIPDTNASIEMFLHDIAGHEVFLEYSTKYCEGASAFVIVYDVTNPESFASMGRWLQIAKRCRVGKQIHGVLVANKADLDSRRSISRQQGEEFAKANKLVYFECSAAQNADVDAPFYYLSNMFHEHFEAAVKSFSKAEH